MGVGIFETIGIFWDGSESLVFMLFQKDNSILPSRKRELFGTSAFSFNSKELN